ncbi:MAG: DUF4406 domain-containing protein, partial [Flammeovirgaceae bacterium]
HDRTWESYMKEDLTEMMKCDAVFSIDNAHDSRGAKIEIALAIELGIKIYNQK